MPVTVIKRIYKIENKMENFIKGFDREDITKAKRDTEIEYTVCLILFVQLIVLFNLYIYIEKHSQ